MENASKALIIAGAILLAILLISVGIMIFNQAQDTITNSGMSEAEITAFNNKFLKYEGKQKGTIVKSLVQDVLSSNSNSNNDERKVKMKVTAVVAGATSTESPTTSGIDNNKTYNVKITYANGLVNEIEVASPSAGGSTGGNTSGSGSGT